MDASKKLKFILEVSIDIFLPLTRNLLGYYTKLVDSKYVCYFCKFYCVFVNFYLVTQTYYLHGFFSVRDLIVFQYSVGAIISFLKADVCGVVFFKHLKTSDAIMGFENVSFGKRSVIAPLYFLYIARQIMVYIIWFDAMSFPVYFMCAASDLNSLLISIYLISIFGRMKLLKKTLENNLVPVNIVGKEQLDKNVNIVRKCVGYYTNMIDAWNIIDNDMQIMLAVALLTNTPIWIMNFYAVVMLFLQPTGQQEAVKLVQGNILSLLMATSPTIVSELISNEIDAIKATLVTQLVRCSDPSLSSELEVALHYIHIPPFKFVICRAVPVDINMPITIIGFCITYVIVFMQFLHFSNL
ncbi:hypothetical protein B5X24_HaOG200958 [Helicoverpa armigera]|nr:hypothetical protein B5X24_HaOG200958 [Helicoverpa armigera]